MPAIADPSTLVSALPADAPAVVPAPWQLTGRAVVGVWHRSRANEGPLWTAIALIAYAGSDVGAYGELIAGHAPARQGGVAGVSVDRIWVDSPASMVGGRANWGLGKELATLEHDPRHRDWRVSAGDDELVRLRHRPWGPPLPVVKPGALAPLLQVWEGRDVRTDFRARALVRPTRLQEVRVHPERVADLRGRRLVAACSVERFAMTFPVARRS